MKFNIQILLLIFLCPIFVYAQLIDNRDLPPEELRIKPPFEPTVRNKIDDADEKTYIILDNADDITIQNFPNDDIIEVVMIGNVRIRFDGNFVKAEKLIVTTKDSTIINIAAYGNIEFTFNKTKYLVESMHYQPSMERGVMYNVRSILDANMLGSTDKPWFFDAKKVTIQSSSRFVLEEVYLTTSDVRFPHYQLKASKLWYIQGKIALVLGMQYMSGQASFFWLPAFFQIEGAGGLHTSFGNEKRIGYYFINNYKIESKFGDFNFGFDFYERQGQYFQVKYKSPQVGILQELAVELDFANDIRLVRNGDYYSQWVLPNYVSAPNYQRISQFAWHYKINTTIGTNGISLRLSLEDLNDPFFLSKYSYRSRFDSQKSIDFQSLINPQGHSWYSYGGDIQPRVDSVAQKMVLTMGKFTMDGVVDYVRTVKPTAENKSNQFLNNYYDYELRSISFPSISYNFGTLNLTSYTNSTKSKVVVVDSRGRRTELSLKNYESFVNKLSTKSNMTISKQVVGQKNGMDIVTNITNWEPIKVTNVSTNDYEWFAINADTTANASFRAQQTFGTNSASTSLDVLTNTNRTLTSDLYQHEEKGSISLNMRAFEQMLSFQNQISFGYQDQWSSFASQKTNTGRLSGLDIDYNLGASFKPSKTWFADEMIKTTVGFDSSVDYSYPLYRMKKIEEGLSPKETSLKLRNNFNLEFLQWRRQTMLGFQIGATYDQRKRIPTDQQQQTIINDPKDMYLKNIVYEQLDFTTKANVWWFNIGTSIRINTLLTETNTSISENFTNRLVGGYPQLLFEFVPHSDFSYIPRVSYRYNLFEKPKEQIDPIDNVKRTMRLNQSFNVDVLWDMRLKNYQVPALYPFIYEISEFGFVFRYYQDFVSMRNSFLRLDFTIGIKFTKYLTFKFTSQMLNNKIYLYYPNGVFNGQRFALLNESSKNFFTDLGDGLKIWDVEALKRSSFKLQSLNFELIHDLDTWDMRIIFNLGRVTDEIKQVAYWEPFIGIAFTMKGSSAVNFFPEFSRRFVPSEFQ